MLVVRLEEPNPSLYRPALEAMRTLIRTSTTSMTSVPKPLKFLRPFSDKFIELQSKWPASQDKQFFADILSVLCMTRDDQKRQTLSFRLQGMQEPIDSWGHEYVRHLAMEVMDEFAERKEKVQETADLLKLAMEMPPFFISHNAEADACDLLMELESLGSIVELADSTNYSRIANYLLSCVPFESFPDDVAIVRVVHEIYRKMKQPPLMLITALKLNDADLIAKDLAVTGHAPMLKQLAFILARQRCYIETADPVLNEIQSQTRLSEYFKNIVKELGIAEPKTPADIYKTHLEARETNLDSAKQNLASSFVNGFVNAGFCTDKLYTEDPQWIYKNKDTGMLSATASLGLVYLWNIEEGLTQMDKYLYAQEDAVKAGALLGIGLLSSGIRDESDPALALLTEAIESGTLMQKKAAIMGIGSAYCATRKSAVADLLLPVIGNSNESAEVVSIAALALGQVFAGTWNADISSSLLQCLMERESEFVNTKLHLSFLLGLALLFAGAQENADAAIEAVQVLAEPLNKEADVLLKMCAYAGTGNVIRIQEMLHVCNDHLEGEPVFQSLAVLAIGVIAMGEEISMQMALRSLQHVMHYGEPGLRRAVPLAQAILYASYPHLPLLDTLSKYSHDNDAKVAYFSNGNRWSRQ